LVAAMAVSVTGVWTIGQFLETQQPVAQPSLDPTPGTPAKSNGASTTPALDTTAFQVALWNPPPDAKADEVAKPAEARKPPNLQLIGIIHEEGILKAAIYDGDADRLFIVASGDRISDREVTVIAEKSVELSDGTSVFHMVLKEQAS